MRAGQSIPSALASLLTLTRVPLKSYCYRWQERKIMPLAKDFDRLHPHQSQAAFLIGEDAERASGGFFEPGARSNTKHQPSTYG